MAPASPESNLPPVQKSSSTKSSFQYVAMDQSGREVKDTMEANDDQEVVMKLQKQGLYPIKVWKNTAKVSLGKPKKKKEKGVKNEQQGTIKKMGGADKLSQKFGIFRVKLKTKQLCLYTRQLATMLDAGLPILLSLRTLYDQCGKGRRMRGQRQILGDLCEYVESGMTLSEALATHPDSFNRLYVGLVRAGEASGAMEAVLGQLADYIEKSEKIKKKVKAGMTYPVVVLVIAGAITLGLMVGIVPKFAEMFAELLEGVPLPWLTQRVIDISDFLMNRFGTLVIVMIVGFFGFRFALRTKIGSFLFDWCCISLPPIKSLTIKTNVARFSQTTGTLLNAGVPILDALQIVKETSTNVIMQNAVDDVYSSVVEGETVTVPLDKTKFFPKMVVRMIDIGEQTGDLPSMLKRIATTYEEEVENTIESLISLIEPLMIVFLAVIIGGIVLALFLPLIKIIESLG